jgi:hypothetical protein
MNYCYQIRNLGISIARVCIKLFLLFLNSEEISLRTTKVCRCHSGKHLKVTITIITYIEKKTIVFDIDETLVYATINRSELK